MSKGPSHGRSGALDDITDWMRQRTEAVATRVRPQARALGHELFKAAIRTGAAMPMATPMAVALAGAQALMQERRGAPPPPARSRKPPIPITRASPAQPKPATATVTRQPAQPLVSSLAAGARGASDAFTFGLGDHLGAGLSAAGGMIQGRDFVSGYQEGMAAAQAQDAEDWRLHPYARATGGVAGTGASLLVASPLALGRVAAGGVRMAALADVPRLKAAAGLVGREVAGLTGLGAVNGAVGQVVMDHALGRGSSASDTAGAALGGAVGTLGLLASRRPQASAALGGATTSMTQDLLGGRPPGSTACGLPRRENWARDCPKDARTSVATRPGKAPSPACPSAAGRWRFPITRPSPASTSRPSSDPAPTSPKTRRRLFLSTRTVFGWIIFFRRTWARRPPQSRPISP